MYDIGVIGGGVAARMAAPALKNFGRVAISYRDTDTPETFSDFDFFDDPRTFFQPNFVKSLYVATPVNTHLAFAVEAIKADIPTLIEKPLALNLAEAAYLESVSPSKLFCGFRKRYSGAAERIKKLRSGLPSVACRIRYCFLAPHPGHNHWKVNKDTSGGGVTMDIGSHILDLYDSCIGPIETVKVSNFELDKLNGTDSYVDMRCSFSDGSVGEIAIGWAAQASIQLLDFVQMSDQISWVKHGEKPSSTLTAMYGTSAVIEEQHRTTEYDLMFRELEKASSGATCELPNVHAGIRNMRLIATIHDQFK